MLSIKQIQRREKVLTLIEVSISSKTPNWDTTTGDLPILLARDLGWWKQKMEWKLILQGTIERLQ